MRYLDTGDVDTKNCLPFLLVKSVPACILELLAMRCFLVFFSCEFSGYYCKLPEGSGPIEERFGREDLLVQIYVQDLLTMVMKNAVSGRAKMDLSRLYDELEKLRALESLERTQEKFGDFLAPG
ncbi:uncharacterized protein TNCV_2928451 [Trichonephila clavipes]|nr:uncharacterized protein TNCV_2928451 [Trichonephila clavipes]